MGLNLLIINHEYPPIGGGGATFSEHLARAFAARGSKVRVLTSSLGRLPRQEVRDACLIRRVSVGRRRSDSSRPLEMARFAAAGVLAGHGLIRSDRPDCILACFALPAGGVALALSRASRVPYLVALLGHDVPGFADELYGRYHGLLMPVTRRIWRHAAAVIANSDGLARLAERTAAPLGIPIHMIPHGVDSAFFAPPAAERGGGPSRLLFVGRLNPQKGLTFLFEALRPLAATTSLVLDVVGDGPGREHFEHQANRLGLGDLVRFHGWVSRQDLVDAYQRADIFVLPSVDEGMSNALLEAMACGLPVVATRVPGSEDLVADSQNGLLVGPRDILALTAALKRLIGDATLRACMGRESRARTMERGWEVIAERYLGLMERATAGAVGPTGGERQARAAESRRRDPAAGRRSDR